MMHFHKERWNEAVPRYGINLELQIALVVNIMGISWDSILFPAFCLAYDWNCREFTYMMDDLRMTFSFATLTNLRYLRVGGDHHIHC